MYPKFQKVIKNNIKDIIFQNFTIEFFNEATKLKNLKLLFVLHIVLAMHGRFNLRCLLYLCIVKFLFYRNDKYHNSVYQNNF